MSNLDLWNKVKQPPPSALKPINAGRLKGKSDINPQWRYQAMTENFGPCGVGWTFEVLKLWTEPGADGQVFAFAHVVLCTKKGEGWSSPIPGVGGSLLIAKEKEGLHSNDEAFKMAVTDALGTAMKMLGVAADVYAGLWDGTKYLAAAPQPGNNEQGAKPPLGARQTTPSGRIPDCPACPVCGGAMWDNRPKKAAGQMNVKAPDAKCKNSACGANGGLIWNIAE